MRSLLFLVLVAVAGLVALLWAAEYGLGPVVIAKEDQFKVILFFGNPVNTLNAGPEDRQWGLRIPLVTTVQIFDKRLQYLNAEPVEIVIAGNEKLIIDYYAVWRITDPQEFMRNYPQGMEQAEKRIREKIVARVGAKIGGLDLKRLLERAEMLRTLGQEVTDELSATGVDVVDVRLNRTELPRNAEPAAYAQMREQRNAISRQHRAVGEREARKVRAKAESDARRIRAAARAKAEVIRGEGDAGSAKIYAEAYGRDAEFYAFWRSLQAYRNTIGERTTIVTSPDHEFFRFLQPEANWARPGAEREGPTAVPSETGAPSPKSPAP